NDRSIGHNSRSCANSATEVARSFFTSPTEARTMKHRNRVKLRVEMLEDRLTPSLTISTDAFANLNITGTPDPGVPAGTSQPITITESAPNTYTIMEGVTPVGPGPFFANNGVNVNFSLSSLNDNVTINLNGNTIPGSVSDRDGAGNDTATITAPV